MKISVGISNRHVHLCNLDYKILFGDIELTKKADLKQPGNYASDLTVTIKTPKRSIDNVRVLGPNREYTQVEISRTDAFFLGLTPPVRSSGDLDNASSITIIGPKGQITLNACIIANRHIHIDESIRVSKGLVGIKKVKIKVKSNKGGIMDEVYLKDSPKAYFELHLDMDDANAFFLNNDDEVEIIL